MCESLGRLVEEAGDRRDAAVVIEFEHIGSGCEGLAIDDELPLQARPVVVGGRLGPVPEELARLVLRELVAEVDECSGPGQYGALSLLYAATLFGSPRDVTLDEIAIETFFPADAPTAGVLRALADARRAL